jgi:hypothetical protein
MTLNGRAHIKGIGAAAGFTWSGIAAHADQILDGANFADGGELGITRDANMKATGLTNVNENDSHLTIDFYPYASLDAGTVGVNNTLANAANAMALPPRPCKVTVSGLTEPSANVYNGDWLYLGGGTCSQSDAEAKLTLPLVRLTSDLSIDALCTLVA